MSITPRFPEQPSTGPAVVIGTATYAERVEAAASMLVAQFVLGGLGDIKPEKVRHLVADRLYCAGLRGQ